MIKIETVLDILKKDGLFREIIDQGHYHYNYSEVVLIVSVMTAVRPKKRASFSSKVLPLRRYFCFLPSLKDSVGMLLKRTMRLVFLPLSSSDIKKAMSLIAMEFYGNPQEKLKLLAFTGTKGKDNSSLLCLQHPISTPPNRPLVNHEYDFRWQDFL